MGVGAGVEIGPAVGVGGALSEPPHARIVKQPKESIGSNIGRKFILWIGDFCGRSLPITLSSNGNLVELACSVQPAVL